MQWVEDPAERKRIMDRMRARPWSNTLDSDVVKSIRAEFLFDDSFDLLGELNAAVWRYRKSTSPETKHTPLTKDEIQAGELRSLASAVALGLWKANNQHQFAIRQSLSSRLGAVARAARNERHAAGRKPDLAMQGLMRSIGCIYERGTGRKPRIGRAKNRIFRGRAYRFAVKVFELAGIQLSDQHIRLVENWKAPLRKSKTIEDTSPSLDSLIVSMSRK